MRPYLVLLIAAAVIVLVMIVMYAIRKPAVGADFRDMGKNGQQGARDAFTSPKESTTDLKVQVKDTVK